MVTQPEDHVDYHHVDHYPRTTRFGPLGEGGGGDGGSTPITNGALTIPHH
jgi:hypothetical protein